MTVPLMFPRGFHSSSLLPRITAPPSYHTLHDMLIPYQERPSTAGLVTVAVGIGALNLFLTHAGLFLHSAYSAYEGTLCSVRAWVD